MRSAAVQKDIDWYNTPRGERYKRMKMALHFAQIVTNENSQDLRGAMDSIISLAQEVKKHLGRNRKKPVYNKTQTANIGAALDNLGGCLTDALVIFGELNGARRFLRRGKVEGELHGR